MKGSLKIALGLIAAAAVGLTIGVAYAPKKGSKTRKQLKRKLEALGQSAVAMSEEAKEKAIGKATQLADQTKNSISNLVEKVKI